MPLSCRARVLACVGSARAPAGGAFAAPIPARGDLWAYRLGRIAARAGTWTSTGAPSRCGGTLSLDSPGIAGGTRRAASRSPPSAGSDSRTDPLGRDIPPPGARGLERSGRNATPARRFPDRSSQRRYGDRAVVVPRDAVAGQEHPAAFRRPNPPDLAPVGSNDSAVVSRREGRRPQAVITRSSLEHPVAIHVAVGSSSAGGTEKVVSPRTRAAALISRPGSSDPAFVSEGDLPSCGTCQAVPGSGQPSPSALGPRVAHFRRRRTLARASPATWRAPANYCSRLRRGAV